MTRRIRESADEDETLARAAALLSAVQPLDTMRMQERVEQRLTRRSPSRSFKKEARVWGIALLLLGATASAMLGTINGWWTPRASNALPPSVEAFPAAVAPVQAETFDSLPQTPPPVVPRARRVSREVAVPSPDLVQDEEMPSAVPDPAAEATAPVLDSVKPLSSALLIQALRELRKEKNALAADQHLVEYLAQTPQSGLREEAWALRLEAQQLSGVVCTSPVAQEYLAEFPEGRYRDRFVEALGACSRKSTGP